VGRKAQKGVREKHTKGGREKHTKGGREKHTKTKGTIIPEKSEEKTLKSGGFSRRYETKKEKNSRGGKRRDRN